MRLEEEIFQRKKLNLTKIKESNCLEKEDGFFFTQKIVNNSLECQVTIHSSSEVSLQIMDCASQEEYINYRIETNTGEFVRQVRQETQEYLESLAQAYFDSQLFIFPQTNRIAQKIKEKYHDTPEFPWDSDANKESAIFRHPQNQKWYALIMHINKRKLNLEDGIIEVMNLKLKTEKISSLLNQDGFHLCYHMNKKHWITLRLDDTLSDETIFSLLQESFELTK